MDWTKFYYANPTPDRFVVEVREAVTRGTADNPGPQLAFATFLGRVMAANPQRIAKWLDELSDLNGAARQLLQLAAWMSGTSEGQAWLRAAGADSRMLEPPPDLLNAPLDGVVLDMLWSLYFATGDERAVRRIVSALGLLDDRGAAQRFATSAKTEDDRRRAMNDAVFQAADWSLRALMGEHPPLIVVCERIFETSNLTPNERICLAIVLERVNPRRAAAARCVPRERHADGRRRDARAVVGTAPERRAAAALASGRGRRCDLGRIDPGARERVAHSVV